EDSESGTPNFGKKEKKKRKGKPLETLEESLPEDSTPGDEADPSTLERQPTLADDEGSGLAIIPSKRDKKSKKKAAAAAALATAAAAAAAAAGTGLAHESSRDPEEPDIPESETPTLEKDELEEFPPT